jgi:hypothetical protein
MGVKDAQVVSVGPGRVVQMQDFVSRGAVKFKISAVKKEPAGNSPVSSGRVMPTDAALRQAVKELLMGADLGAMSMKTIRTTLEARLVAPLASNAKKAVIKGAVDAFYSQLQVPSPTDTSPRPPRPDLQLLGHPAPPAAPPPPPAPPVDDDPPISAITELDVKLAVHSLEGVPPWLRSAFPTVGGTAEARVLTQICKEQGYEEDGFKQSCLQARAWRMQGDRLVNSSGVWSRSAETILSFTAADTLEPWLESFEFQDVDADGEGRRGNPGEGATRIGVVLVTAALFVDKEISREVALCRGRRRGRVLRTYI